MKSSKLYSILEHFDKYEQNRCRKYIISPYFNKNEALIDIYEVLIKNINAVKPKNLSREDIWTKVHNDKNFDDVRCRKYLSDLLKLVEGFLAQSIFEANNLQQAAYLIEAVGQKKMKKLYNSTMRMARRTSDNYPFQSANFFLYQYLIEMNYYNMTQSEMQRSEKTNLQSIIENLDNFYFAEKLRLVSSILIRQRYSAHNYEISFIKDIVQHIKESSLNQIPVVLIYYQIYLTMVDDQNEEFYFKLKDLLTKFSLKFPPNEAYQLYTAAINYSVKKINKGNSKFLQELFELYHELTENKIVLVDNKLSPWTFQNIVVVALRLGKFQWTDNFINNYKHYLPIQYRDNAVSYNSARLYWYQKKHDQVIQLLREVEYEDVSYNLGSKSMLIATYYETDEIDALYFLLESFRAYLNRHKDIPAQRRNNYKNLIKFTKKLTKTRSGDKEAIKKLKDEIENTKGIADKKWLSEKIAELENPKAASTYK